MMLTKYSYTMIACLPVCGENPHSLIVSGLSYVQVDKHGIIKITTSV